MKIIEMLPKFDDKSLKNLFDNTTRIIAENIGKQVKQANEVLPHVVAELARRKEKAAGALAERSKLRAAERQKAKQALAAAKTADTEDAEAKADQA